MGVWGISRTIKYRQGRTSLLLGGKLKKINSPCLNFCDEELSLFNQKPMLSLRLPRKVSYLIMAYWIKALVGEFGYIVVVSSIPRSGSVYLHSIEKEEAISEK